MVGGEHVGNPDSAEHEYNEGLGFKRNLSYGVDVNGVAQPVLVNSDGSLVVRDKVDQALEEGKLFSINQETDLDIAGLINISFLSGVETELIIGFSADSGPATWEVSSGGSVADGSPITPFNPNIVLSTASLSTVTLNGTVTSDSVKLSGTIGGGTGGNAFGDSAEGSQSILIPTSTRINLEIVSLSNSNNCSVSVNFIERT